jgi:hypothetical protein
MKRAIGDKYLFCLKARTGPEAVLKKWAGFSKFEKRRNPWNTRVPVPCLKIPWRPLFKFGGRQAY